MAPGPGCLLRTLPCRLPSVLLGEQRRGACLCEEAGEGQGSAPTPTSLADKPQAPWSHHRSPITGVTNLNCIGGLPPAPSLHPALEAQFPPPPGPERHFLSEPRAHRSLSVHSLCHTTDEDSGGTGCVLLITSLPGQEWPALSRGWAGWMEVGREPCTPQPPVSLHNSECVILSFISDVEPGSREG